MRLYSLLCANKVVHQFIPTLIPGIMLFYSLCFGSSQIIENIHDTTIVCDYLIITPAKFLPSAITLAQHRNTFLPDDVSHARIIVLDQIYKEFTHSDTLQKHEIIWGCFKWIYYNWRYPVRYVTLMGDDKFQQNSSDSPYHSIGNMPTYLEKKMNREQNNRSYEVNFSDDWYTALQCKEPPSDKRDLYSVPLTLGRIPCETNYQCSVYVSKVITFDTQRPAGSWQNRVLVSTDDGFTSQGAIDYIRHYDYGEQIANEYCKNYVVTKCPLLGMKKNSLGKHQQAKEFFFNQVNKGSIFSIFFGHGNQSELTDESFLTFADKSLFDNKTMPFIFFAFGCKSAAFYYPSATTLCKQWLFYPQGGIILYFGVVKTATADPNLSFMKSFFTCYSSNPELSIGKAVFAAKTAIREQEHFILLGDPALRLVGKHQPMTLTLNPSTSVPLSVQCSVQSATPFIGKYVLTISTIDSVPFESGTQRPKCLRDSVLLSLENDFTSSFYSPLPSLPPQKDIRINCYAYNTESRASSFLILKRNTTKNIAIPQLQRKPVSLQIHKGLLKIDQNHVPHITSLYIYTIQGKLVLQQTNDPLQNTLYIDLKKNRLSYGHYILRVKTTTNDIVYRINYTKFW